MKKKTYNIVCYDYIYNERVFALIKNGGISAVITAAGSSERFGKDKNEQLLGDYPCLVHTLIAFERSEQTVQTVGVTRKEKIETILSFKEKYGLSKLSAVVEGGRCRQSSAAIGFNATDPRVPFVAIHDGARPLITPIDIDNVALAAYEYGAAIAAMPQVNTVKLITEDGFIKQTIDRKKLLAAATPQIFSREIYGKIVEKFSDRFSDFTDDSSMAEELGIAVKTVICQPSNIKITTVEDLLLAETILSGK